MVIHKNISTRTAVNDHVWHEKVLEKIVIVKFIKSLFVIKQLPENLFNPFSMNTSTPSSVAFTATVYFVLINSN